MRFVKIIKEAGMSLDDSLDYQNRVEKLNTGIYDIIDETRKFLYNVDPQNDVKFENFNDYIYVEDDERIASIRVKTIENDRFSVFDLETAARYAGTKKEIAEWILGLIRDYYSSRNIHVVGHDLK